MNGYLTVMKTFNARGESVGNYGVGITWSRLCGKECPPKSCVKADAVCSLCGLHFIHVANCFLVCICTACYN